MEISDIRVRLIQESKERLRAVCSVTFDDAFVVRDVKVVDGTNGTFVAMPSRKLSVHCPKCRHKNQIRARYCNECGGKLPPARPPEDANGRSRFHRDIAHPINTEFRELFQKKVLEAFERELAENGDARDSDSEPMGTSAEDRSDERTDALTTESRPAAVEDGDVVGVAGVVEEKSEYDSLIAGLKSGGGERSQSDSDRGGDRGQGRGQGRGRSGRGDNDRDRDSRGERQQRSEKREERVAEKVAPPPTRPVERVAEPSVVDATDDSEDTQFGAEIVVETQTPKETITPCESEPVQEVVETVDDDDDCGFGAGLL